MPVSATRNRALLPCATIETVTVPPGWLYFIALSIKFADHLFQARRMCFDDQRFELLGNECNVAFLGQQSHLFDGATGKMAYIDRSPFHLLAAGIEVRPSP